MCCVVVFFFFFKQKTAYEMRISDWSSDVCSSDLIAAPRHMARTMPETTRRATITIPARLGKPPMLHLGELVRIGDADRHLDQMQRHGRQIGRASCRERVCQYV